jgi:Leucine-rich repeat (LRR) protein
MPRQIAVKKRTTKKTQYYLSIKHNKKFLMNKFTLLIVLALFLFLSNTSLNAQLVTVPDSIFKAYLLGNSAINTNGDTAIQVSEAVAFTATLDVSNQNISDLTGIEAFTAIPSLNCSGNQLSSLNVSSNIVLTVLKCFNNQITALDVTSNTALSILSCYLNQISALDVSLNTALTSLSCGSNQITALDLSANTALVTMYCEYNQITSLDVSSNTLLNTLLCNNNLLTSLNVQNGNNSNFITTPAFNATANPNLSCIEVDDVSYSTTNWVNIDAGASFSTNCFTNISSIPESMQNIKAYPNPIVKKIQLDLGKIYNNVAIKISNSIGQLIFNKKYFFIEQLELDLNEPNGIYFINILTEEGQHTLSVTKQ